MKHKPAILLALCALLIGAPGCSVLAPRSDITWEGQKFLTFQDVWTVTLAAYDRHMDYRVAGKVSADDARDVDTAWNVFRVGFRAALARAQGGVVDFAPDEVKKLANDVLTLIYASQ